MVVYGIPNCDTVRKARRWLDSHGVAFTFHDLRKDGLDAATLARWVEALGWEALLNRRGTTWRQLPQAHRDALDADSAFALMLEQPAIIKRPVIEQSGAVSVGFSETDFAARFP